MRTVRIVLLALTFALSFACYQEGDKVTPEPLPTEPAPPTLVQAGGQCGALTTSIQCSDGSRCTQGGAEVTCASIDWTLFLGNVRVTSIPKGPEDVVTFGELAPGEYRVEQTARAKTGETSTKDYPVTVTGGALK